MFASLYNSYITCYNGIDGNIIAVYVIPVKLVLMVITDSDMGKKKRSASNLELVGGALCLNFTNTVSTRSKVPYREYLPTYNELVTWRRHVNILTDDEAQTLLHNATRHPELAADVLERAITLREAIFGIFAPIAGDQEPTQNDLAVLNTSLHETLARLEIRSAANGFEWTWVPDPDALDRMLWPVIRSAADLLTSENHTRVRRCAGEECDWLFVDTSKNRSRRWCMMGVCGSRVKARRYYQRKRKKT
jgi:predicted RNA-binding Zn ribbon-like protein